jgi:zinc D-Ala-D-Ala carboxypeptidase
MNKKQILLIAALLLVCLGLGLYAFALSKKDTDSHSSHSHTHDSEQPSTKAKPASFDKTQYSTTDPKSIWVVVNKQRPLEPKTYTPSDLRIPNVSQRVPGNESMRLRGEVATAVEKMFADAQASGHALQLSSGFRSYNFQVTLYGDYVKKQGQATADTQSARPGYSEHQTGLSLDVRPPDGSCYLEECFGETAAGKWVAANAYKHGFIMRYTPIKQSVTGYKYEPWHFRYVGVALATEMHHQNIETLEEFFNLGSAPDYQ